MDEQRMMDIMDDLPEHEAREQIALERERERLRIDLSGVGRRCTFCNGMCVPTGTCHTCQSCGETTGCG
jgi:hypothetical protein